MNTHETQQRAKNLLNSVGTPYLEWRCAIFSQSSSGNTLKGLVEIELREITPQPTIVTLASGSTPNSVLRLLPQGFQSQIFEVRNLSKILKDGTNLTYPDLKRGWILWKGEELDRSKSVVCESLSVEDMGTHYHLYLSQRLDNRSQQFGESQTFKVF